MGRERGTERVAGDLFIPQAMPWGETQCTPGELTQTLKGVCKGGFLPLLAPGKAIVPTVEIAERKQRWVLIWGLVICVRYVDTWPLRG